MSKKKSKKKDEMNWAEVVRPGMESLGFNTDDLSQEDFIAIGAIIRSAVSRQNKESDNEKAKEETSESNSSSNKNCD